MPYHNTEIMACTEREDAARLSASATTAAASCAAPVATSSAPAAAAAANPPRPPRALHQDCGAAAAATTPTTATATTVADMSDVPLDVLSTLILPRLPPGHRLDVRAVNRRWATWVDGGLAPATHINLVMDRGELEAAAAAAAATSAAAAATAAADAAAVAAVGNEGRSGDGEAGAAGSAGGWGAWLSQRAIGGTASSHGAAGQPAAGGEEAAGWQPPQEGVLARRFPSVVAARLWVGCRPPASVAGTNGGGLSARARAETAAAAARGAGGSSALRRCRGSGWKGTSDPATSGAVSGSGGRGSTSSSSSSSTATGHNGPLQLHRSLSTSLAVALEDCCSRAAEAPGRIAAAAVGLLVASGSCLFPMATAAMRRRLGGGEYYYGGRRGGRGGGGGAGGSCQPSYRWHVHKQKVQEGGGGGGGRGARPAVVRNADGTFQLLRRYSQDAFEPQSLPPLPQCLPLLGGSAALRRLSLVSAYDLTAETLALLASAFPNLSALSLHAHHAPGVDPTPVCLRHRPAPTGGMTCTTLDEARAAANAVRARALSTTAAGASAGAPSSDDAAPAGSSSGSRQLRRRHSGVAEDVVAAAAARTAAREHHQQHWALRSPLAARLPQLTTLALCGLRLGDPEAEVLGALSGLRALTLHRVTCRVHRLLPHLESGLTRLTRLELRRLDYFHSLPLDAADNAALEARERRRAAGDADRGGVSRHMARLQRQEDAARRRAARLAARRRPLLSSLLGRGPGSGAGGAGIDGADAEAADIAAANAAAAEAAAFADLLSGPDSDAEEEERQEEAALDADLEEGGMAGAPWMSRQSRGLFPDWPGALWSLGRALRRLPGLQVLVADVECPARGQQDAWAALLLGVKQLHGLTELRLPHLAFGSAWQVRSLAAALPLLTCLEFGSLPPVPRTPEVCAWLTAGGRSAGFRAHMLGQHVACGVAGSSRLRGGHGPALPPPVIHPAFASREMLGWCYLSEEGQQQGPLLVAAAAARAAAPTGGGSQQRDEPGSPLRRSTFGAAVSAGRDGTAGSTAGGRCRRASDSSSGLLRARAAAARPDCTAEDGLAPPGSGSSSGSDSRSSSAGRRRVSGSSGHGLLPSRFSGSGAAAAAAAAAASGHPSPLGLMGAGEPGAPAADVGGLCCFKQLRQLVVRRVGLEELAVHGLPLPPRLARAELPLQAMVGAGHDSQPVQFSDLLLLHSSLLPALAALPSLANLHLTLGPARGADGPLLAAMLGAWLGPGGAVRGLDVRGLTHPSGTSGGELTETLQRIASGLPRLERLSCYLWGGPGGLLQPEAMAAATTASGSGTTCGSSSGTSSSTSSRTRSWTQRVLQPITTAAAQLGGMRRSPSGAAVAEAPPAAPAPPPPPARRAPAAGGRAFTVSTAAGGKTAEAWLAAADAPGVRLAGAALDAINRLPLLDELRIKVLSLPASASSSGPQPPGWGGGDDMLAALRRPTAASRFGSCTVRVPLGLLRGLRRSLRVVDCSPLESWCSSPFAVEGGRAGAGLGTAGAGAAAEADPRVALAYARGLLAAEGVCSSLVAEAEEWAAGAIGVGPDLEERWRGEALPRVSGDS
ncbi:hypothetical protein HYH02_005515 [Chlamydomonas schloesseri]|uniref:Uncharacterized protein n=1 Tax=Chlamydomonas schloesseri TaxID=2026947 RepID=A0A836B6U9_9CHLO|nr:hypothetical protein HYH02_005515 [Chlamydomonas schloesseri]|eukprot:KAG2449362.1 hypothetical protein HYH02_005515 [Chlamydomonas schloesseri]